MGLLKGSFFIFVMNIILFYLLDKYIFSETFEVWGGPMAYILFAAFFGIVNFFLRPILNLITLPIRIVTLGAIALLINAFLLWISVHWVNIFESFGVGVSITEWETYFLLGIVFSMGNGVTHWFVK